MKPKNILFIILILLIAVYLFFSMGEIKTIENETTKEMAKNSADFSIFSQLVSISKLPSQR